MTVTPEAAGSSPVDPANYLPVSYLQCSGDCFDLRRERRRLNASSLKPAEISNGVGIGVLDALGGSQMELDFLVGRLLPLATSWIISTRIAGTMFVFIALTAHLP